VNRRLRDLDRAVRRAAAGASIGAILGLLCGLMLGFGLGWGYRHSVYTGYEGAWIAAAGGVMHGCLIGPLILLRKNGPRLAWGTAISTVGNAAWAAAVGHEIVQTVREAHIGAPEWVHVVGAFALMGGVGGALGGFAVAAGLGWLRAYWPWMTRWDPLVEPGAWRLVRVERWTDT
jgi:hypothetical protein